MSDKINIEKIIADAALEIQIACDDLRGFAPIAKQIKIIRDAIIPLQGELGNYEIYTAITNDVIDGKCAIIATQAERIMTLEVGNAALRNTEEGYELDLVSLLKLLSVYPKRPNFQSDYDYKKSLDKWIKEMDVLRCDFDRGSARALVAEPDGKKAINAE